MSIVYPIADMLTRIRNATHKRHAEVSLPHSRVKEAIARILESEGYILGLEVVPRDPQPLLLLKLKYQGERSRAVPAITGIRLVSKPSRRMYAGKDELPKPRAGMGTCIVSTSAGILSGVEAAARGLGGEVLFEVW
jgi:small subunit ribosomal protein S8